MYIVNIINGGNKTEIHGEVNKLTAGSIVKGINTIDSFTFTIHQKNEGFNLLNDMNTFVCAKNVNKNRTEFFGRVLYTSLEMDSDGMISKSVTCENILGFLHDSQQVYIAERNWTVNQFLGNVIGIHNEYVEDDKKFTIGLVEGGSDNLFCGIQRESSFKTIQDKLINARGGEVRAYESDDSLTIDYVEQIGEFKTTKIELSRNMKAITRERDPSEIVTRLFPLGAKVSEDSEARLCISGRASGDTDGDYTFTENDYIDNETAIAQYGIRVGYKIWDDVTDANTLRRKGEAWLAENARVLVKYSITALDLSLLGLDIDDFEVGNTHPIVNPLLGIEDTARIIKKTINILDETKNTIEIGDKFKTMSDIQRDQKKESVAYSKSEIVSGVINALPTWNGGVY